MQALDIFLFLHHFVRSFHIPYNPVRFHDTKLFLHTFFREQLFLFYFLIVIHILLWRISFYC